MDLLELFKRRLVGKNGDASKNTVKNYLSDIRHFILWFENTTKKSFDAGLITSDIVVLYKRAFGGIIKNGILNPATQLSAASLKRHLSSLRRFISVLKEEGVISENPFESIQPETNTEPTDYWHLKSFKDYLLFSRASKITVKNYLSDIQGFSRWYEEAVLPGLENPLSSNQGFYLLTQSVLEDYRKRLIEIQNAAPRTINRKLSSLRKYLEFATKKGFINASELTLNPVKLNDSKPLVDQPQFQLEDINNSIQNSKCKIQNSYSSFPPFRLAQKLLIFPYLYLEEKAANYIAALLIGEKVDGISRLPKKLRDELNNKNVLRIQNLSISSFLGINNIKKEFYAPDKVSLLGMPLYKKAIYHARFTRPKWYKRYHNNTYVHYVHFALLVIFASGVGVALYQNLVAQKQTPSFAAATAPPRILSFQGRLTDNLDNPITTPQQVRFMIYNNVSSSSSAELWEEVRTISPDQDGIFSVLLGSDINGANSSVCGAGTYGTFPPGSPYNTSCQIPPTVFSDNSQIWLGVTIGSTTELSPRQKIATVGYATNSEFLQGQPPTTQAGLTSYKNVILALDSSGNLILNDSGATDHTLQVVNGAMILQGQNLRLTTNTGSNGNVILSPDGLGKIDIQHPMINTTTMGNIVPGGVEVDDRFGVLATESAIAAFIVNNNTSGGDILTASSSGSPKFTVQNDGTLVSGKYTTAGGLLYANGSGVVAQTSGTSGQCLTGGTTPSWGTCGSSYWNLANGTLAPFVSSLDLLIGGQSTASAKFGFINNATGSPTATISGNLALVVPTGNTPASLFNLYNNGSLNFQTSPGGDAGLVSRFFLSNNGTIGMGTASPISELQVSRPLSYGATGKALVIFDQIENQDIFTASAGGITKFTITNGGGIGLGGNIGTSGQCITGGSTASWGICGGNSSPFQVLLGSIVPFNSTEDLLVGGQSTASAKFAVINMNTGTPVASISAGLNGGISISANGIVQTTNNQGLTIGGPASGDLVLKSYNNTVFQTPGTANTYVGALAGAGASNTGTHNSFFGYNSGFSNTSGSYNFFFGDAAGYANQSGSYNTFIGEQSGSANTIGANNTYLGTNTGLLNLSGGHNTFVGNNAGFTDTAGNNTFIGDSAGFLNDTGTGNVFIGLNAGYTLNPTYGNVSGNNNTYIGYNSGPGTTTQLTNASAFGYQAMVALNNSMVLGGTGAYAINVGIGTATPAATLEVDGGNMGGNAALIVNQIGVNSNNIFTASSAALPKFTITNLGGIGLGGSVNVGTNTQCLLGGAAASWGSCASGYWNIVLGALTPYIDTLDLLVGGQTTASAKFRFVNVNSGTPVASISANNGNNATFLSGDGTLGTTNRQTLTIGNSSTYNSTGNLLFNPNGIGKIGIGTSNPLVGFDLRGNSGTTAAASISATTSFATLIVDNAGLGDLFTASSSGVPSFIVKNNGDIVVGQGGIGKITAGVVDPYLIQNQKTTGTMSLTLQTMGATNADFIFKNQSTTLGTLTQAGQLQLPVTSSTGGLVMGGDTQIFRGAADRIDIAANDSINFLTGTGSLQTNGTTRIDASGNGTFANLVVSGSCTGCISTVNSPFQVASGAIVPGNTTLDFIIGAQATASAKFAVLNISGTTPIASISSGLNGTSMSMTSDGTLATSRRQTLTIGNSTAYNTTGNVLINPNGIGNVGIGTTTPTALLQVNGGNWGGNAALIVNQTGNTANDIFTASASGVTKFVIANSGSVGIGTNAPATSLEVDGTSSTNVGQIIIRDTAAAPTANIGGHLSFGFHYNTAAPTTYANPAEIWGLKENSTDNNYAGYLAFATAAMGGNNIEKMRISSAGNIGIGTTSPLSELHVTRSLTLGATGKALAIFDQIENQDIFTASAGGITKFTITNLGGIGLGGSVGTGSQCITGGATAAWGSCGSSSGTNWWTQTPIAGAITPINSTMDFLIGSQATTSAKFALLNLASGTPVASVGGNFIVMPYTSGTNEVGGSVGIGTTTPGAPLHVVRPGGNQVAITSRGTNQDVVNQICDGGHCNYWGSDFPTGNLFLEVGTLNKNVFTVSPTGNIGLGTNTAISELHVTRPLTLGATGKALAVFDQIENQDIFTASAGGITKFTITNLGGIGLGGSVGTGSQCITGGATATWGICGSGSNWNVSSGVITPKLASTLDFLLGGTSTASAKFAVLNINGTGPATATVSGNIIVMPNNGAGGNLGIGTITPSQRLDVNGNAWVGPNSSSILPDGNTANRFLIVGDSVTPNVAGEIHAIGNTAGTNNAVGDLTFANYNIGATDKRLSIILGATDGAINSGNLIFYTYNAGTIGERMRIDHLGNVGIGTIAPLSELHVTRALSAGANGKALAIFDQIENQDILTASAGGVTKFTITNTGGIGLGGSVGTSLNCLLGGATATWGSCGSSSTNWWTQTPIAGALSPINSTMDFLIGAQATTSAKFAILNISGTTPIASVSSGLNGTSMFMTSDGTLATSRRQTLTIGNSTAYNTTGNILINPNGVGYMGIGTTTPLASFDLRYALAGLGGTLPVASISGKTTNAVLVVDNSGVGDLFSASSSGVTQFVIKNNGAIGIGLGNSINPTAQLDVTGSASISSALTFRTGTGQIQTTAKNTLTIGGNTTGNLIFDPNATNLIGAGTQTPLASFDLRYAFGVLGGGTLPVASISGKTSFAGLVVDNTGLGDIFTASTGGVTKFTITNSGALQFSNYKLNGGIFYADGSGNLLQTSVGLNGQCLQSVGGGSPTWGSCVNNTNSPFQVLNGAIVQNNTTEDFLIGGTATASAKFAVLNIAGTTPIASISSGLNGTSLFMTADGTLATSRRQTLTIGNSTAYNTTGNVLINPNGVGYMGIGTTTPLASFDLRYALAGLGGTLPVASISGKTTNAVLVVDNSGVGDLLSASTAGLTRFTIKNDGTASSSAGFIINGIGNIQSTRNQTLTIGGNSTGNIILSPNNGSGNIILSNLTGQNAVLFATQTTGVLAQTTTASSNLCLLSGASSPTWGSCVNNTNSPFQVLNGAIVPNNTTEDFLIGGTSTTSAKFAVLNISGTTPIASVSSGLNGTSMFMTADGTLSTQNRQTLTIGNSSAYNTTGNILINPNGIGNVGIGTTTPTALLQVNGGNWGGNAALIVNQTGNTANDIFTASASGVTKFVIKNDGTASSSAGFTIDGNGSIQSTRNQTLTLGGNTTGNVIIKSLNSIVFQNPGTANIFVGAGAGNVTTGSHNSFFGYQSGLVNSSGNFNAFFGDTSGLANTTGSDNAFLGMQAGSANTTGAHNLFVGNSSGISNVSGDANTFVGESAGFSNTAGYNTFVGNSAGFTNTTGTGNVFVGYYAGDTATPANANDTGNNNTFIGYQAGPGTSTQLTNAAAIGYQALVSQSNTLVLGGTGANAVSVGIGTTTPKDKLDVNGNINILDNSQYRWGFDGVTNRTFIDGSNANGSTYMSFWTGSNQRLYINDGGNVGIGDTSPASLLTVGSGDLFQVNSSGDIVASTGLTLTSGAITLGASTGTGQCITGGATAGWGACGGGGGAFSETSGTIIQNNTSEDFLLGGTSTASAKFAMLNMNSGTPTLMTTGDLSIRGGTSNLTASADVANLNKSMGANVTGSWSTGATGGTARRGHTSVLYNGKIYAWGGGWSGVYLNSLDIYDIANNSWSTGASGGTAREDATSILYNGKIYSWGGTNGGYLNTVDIYDIASNSWSTGTAGGTARSAHTSVLYNGKIYSWGGNNGSDLNTVDIYDIASNSWSTGTAGGTARQRHTSVIYNGKIYSWAGYGDYNTVDIYDIASNSWSTGTAGGTARRDPTSVLYNGKIYAWGGYGGGYLNTVDIYDIASNSWSTGTAGGTARQSPTSVLYNGKMYMWGGNNGGLLNSMDIYDIGFKQTILALQENGQDMLSFQTGSQLFLSSGRLSIMGGNVGIGVATPSSTLYVTHPVGSSLTGKALVVFDQTENQDIFTASSSGITRFTLSNNGTVNIGTAQFANALPTQFGAKLNVWSNLLSQPAASISAKTSVPTLLVTQDGTGDIINGSAAGVLVFRVDKTGQVQAANGFTGISADFAEYYKKANPDELFSAGQLVCLSASGATKCSNVNPSQRIIGVISDNPLVSGGGAHKDDPDYVLVGMVGQLGVSVTGDVKAGDPLSLSSTPGVATVAKTEGNIIGYAKESNDGNSERVDAIIQPNYYNPNTALQNENIFGQLSLSINNGVYSVVDALGNSISHIDAFSKVIIGSIEAGFAHIRSLAVDTISAESSTLGNATANTFAVAANTITIGGQDLRDIITQTVNTILTTTYNLQPTNLISPLAKIDSIKTNIISPLADTSAPSIAFQKSEISIQNSATGQTVAWFDNQGNASFSGQLTADSVEANSASISGNLAANSSSFQTSEIRNLKSDNATISGTLRAGNIIAANIEGLDSKISSIASQLIASNQQSIANSQQSSASSSASSCLLTSGSCLLSANTVSADFGIFEQGITSMGPITSNIITATDQLAVGNSFTISNNAINTVGADLELQSLKQGNIAFEGGLIRMDTDGNMIVNGNMDVLGYIHATSAVFSNDLTAKTLTAGLISPLPASDLVIELHDSETNPAGKLKVQDSTGHEVLSVNSRGDIISSGSAQFAKLNLNFVGQAQATSLTEAVATGSAGFATLRSGQPELTIKNSNITSKSLIYITPFGDTNGQVLYLLRQLPQTDVVDGSFTVGLSGTLPPKDMQFNWLIVN